MIKNFLKLLVNEFSLMTEIEELKSCDFSNVSACMITQLNGVVADMNPIEDFCKMKNISISITSVHS